MLKFYSLLAIGSVAASLTGCYIDVNDHSDLPVYRPVLMARASLEQSVTRLDPREVHRPGKTLRQGTLLLINERYEGIHLFDNQDPTQPRSLGFVRVPGCLDMHVRGQVLYADNAVDLVTLDLRTPATTVPVLSRTRNALPELPLPEPATVETAYRPENRPADAVVVGWQRVN